METLESSRVCRLCGKHSGISINIFDKNENHVKKINAVLPIMVHEMDLLPKHMCHRCSYKLEEFHKFYVDCLKTDEDLKGQLSWMRKEDSNERIGVPMVQIENVKIKAEPPDYNVYDLDPIADNVNYINSMSTVTFPVNGVPASSIHEGITYAAYARCGCCCDKKDQSKQTVSTNYETTASRCSRLESADGTNFGRCPGKLQTIKKNLLDDDAFQDRPPTNLRCGDETKEIPKCQIVSSAPDVGGVRIKANHNDEVASGSTIVHNLRPKRGSVDYAETRKKMSPAAVSGSTRRSKSAESKMTSQSKSEVMQIKLEKPDNFEERVLRPRKKAIDYFQKRKYSKCMDMEHTSPNDENHAKYKLRNITCESREHPTTAPKLPVNDRTKLAIKQELLEDTAVHQESITVAPRISKRRRRSTAADPDENVSALRNNVLVNVHNDVPKYSSPNRAQLRSNISVANKFKSSRSPKRRLKLNKLEFSQIDGISYSPKHLRSQDVYLRNGKLRNFDGAERSVKKVRNNHRSAAEDDRIADLMRTIKKTVNAKKDSATMKLVDNNIKHFCEKCNVSFASKELFKLHACYG